MTQSPINPIHKFNSYTWFDKQWCAETARVLLKSLDHNTPLFASGPSLRQTITELLDQHARRELVDWKLK